MIAGALVAQRALDHDEIGRGAERRDLARRGHADEKPASRGEQLLGEQHGKRRADRAADDAEAHRRVLELEQLGMVAGPAGRRRRPARPVQRPHDVAVRVEQADLGHLGLRQIFLAPRLAQQVGRLEHRRGRMILVGKDRRLIWRIETPDHTRFVPARG